MASDSSTLFSPIIDNPIITSDVEVIIKDAIARAICRPNIELLLDAVESTEKAAAEKATTNEMTDPPATTTNAITDSGHQTTSQHHRRNIDMLLDAVESTKMAADAESRVHHSSAEVIVSTLDPDVLGQYSGQSVIREEIVDGNVIPTAIKNELSPIDLMTTNGNDNVVVEKIVTYLGDYSPIKPTFDVMEVVVATTPLDADRGTRGGGKRQKSTQNKSKPRVTRIKRLKPNRARTKASVPSPEDDRSWDMVVPVDPRFMDACRANGDGELGDGVDVSDDECNNLLEVEVPGPFRSVGTKESTHSTEAIDFALTHNLIKKFKSCPTCGTEVALNITTLMFRCSRTLKNGGKSGKKKRCQWHQSARPGTWFENAHMSVQGVLHITFLWLNMKRPRQDFVIEQLSCSSRTVVDWSSYCREVCVNWAESESEVLGGPGLTVELYEPKIVNRKRKGTQIMNGKWIFCGFERGSSKIFIVPVPERSKESLLLVVKQWIKAETTVVSDCWRSCKCVGDAAYKHETVSRGYTFVDPERGEPMNHVEQVWREVKCSIPRSGPCDMQLLGYLSEFLFKRKYGNSESRTLHFFEMVSKMYPGN